MVILERPYISEFLKETVTRLQIPVMENEVAKKESFPGPVNLVPEEVFIERIRTNDYPVLYTNSENTINWISNYCPDSVLAETIHRLKDKYTFRKFIQTLYPEFEFHYVQESKLEELDTRSISKPFVIKPTVGFVSMGVYTVHSDDEWPEIIRSIRSEIHATKNMYPAEVINTEKFLIEERIDGEEFAVDAYFDENGQAVILNIMKHLFSSEDDVDDKVYIMSSEIIRKHLESFTETLNKMGKILDLKRFPIHVEFRVNPKYNVIPIEANPMRFAGWCTTDVTRHAYGINIYEYYLKQEKPDWDTLLRGREGNTYSINVAAIDSDKITSDDVTFDYDELAHQFQYPLEIRKTDYRKYGLAGFVFAKTTDPKLKELYRYLNTDANYFLKRADTNMMKDK